MIPTRPARLRTSWLLLTAGLLVTLATFALAACGTSTQVATPTATPDASAILQQASQTNITDASFTLTLATTIGAQAINGTGAGAVTKTPARVQLSLTIPVTAGGTTTQITSETVTDAATHTVYSRTTLNGVVGKWTKSTSSANSSSSVDVNGLTSLTSYQNAKVIGSETIDGVAVWHLQATPGTAPTATTTATTSATPTKTPKISSSAATKTAVAATKTAVAGATQTAITNATTVDIYIRKDNSYPVKIASHVAVTGANTDVTLTFTKINSGVTITLPNV